MKTVYFVRHGQTLFNQEKRLQGWMDSPLSDQGIEQVNKVALALQPLNIHSALVSPLGRAQQTAEIIHQRLSIPMRTIPELREVSFGDFEGNTLLELDEMFPGQWDARMADKWNYRPQNGEANKDAVPRAKHVVELIEKSPDGHNLLVIAHFAINRIILAILGGLQPEETVQMNVPHSFIYRAQYAEGHWRLSYKDTDIVEDEFHPGWIKQLDPAKPVGG